MPVRHRAVALLNVAWLWCELGHFEDAVRLAADVPDLEFTGPAGFQYLLHRSTIALLTGELAEAQVWFDRASSILDAEAYSGGRLLLVTEAARLAWITGSPAPELPDPAVLGGTYDYEVLEVALWSARLAAREVERGRAAGDPAALEPPLQPAPTSGWRRSPRHSHRATGSPSRPSRGRGRTPRPRRLRRRRRRVRGDRRRRARGVVPRAGGGGRPRLR